MSDERDWVRIERDFEATIDKVWDMWTNPDLFKKWYGPNGMAVPVAEMDVAVGGTRKVCMEVQSPERTMSMWFTGVYKEVIPPRRLVYTESMCDAEGNIMPPQAMGMPEGFPDITEVIIELSQTGDKTRMVLVHVGVEAGTAGAGGWGQACDKLAAFLEASRAA